MERPGIVSSLRRFYHSYRGEIIITTVSSIVSLVASLLVTLAFDFGDPYLVGFYFFVFVIVMLLFGLLFNQRRLIDSRFWKVNQVILDLFGPVAADNQFYLRRTHYAAEKLVLAKVLVREVLPRVIKEIYKNHPTLRKLNIIIDSGTTLTPVFPLLVTEGLPKQDEVALQIYSNSMSGIDEIHKMEDSGACALSERDFNLLGGQPLNKYRATTGEATERFLQSLWEESDSRPGGEIVTLGILTANWFLAGAGYNRISICARGSGHLRFKTEVSEHSQYRILVAPLGKILHLSDVEHLNDLLKDQEGSDYGTYELPAGEDVKSRTQLLTTRRYTGSLSPFQNITILLDKVEKQNSGVNFILCPESPRYSPPGHSFEEVLANEAPNVYVKERFEEAYGFAERL